MMVQNQYAQNSKKNYDTEMQMKQDISKHFFSDPKDCWEIESGCNEDFLGSENDSEGEDNNFYPDSSDFPEQISDTRRLNHYMKKRQMKNVRFEGPNYNCFETSSFDNDDLGECGGCIKTEINHRKGCRGIGRLKFWDPEKRISCDRRPRSEPERSTKCLENNILERRPVTMGEYNDLDHRYRTRRSEHKCSRHHDPDYELLCKKIHSPHKYECGDDMLLRHRHGDCCNRFPTDDGWVRLEKKSCKMKMTPNHKHICYSLKELSEYNNKSFHKTPHHPVGDRYFPNDEYNFGTKSKKKTLEAVQEQQEQMSDSTYKVPCSKYSSQTIPGDLSGFLGKKSSEKLANLTQSDWLFCEGRGYFNEKYRDSSSRIHKMRSRRTRMNRLKSGWKKAFVQTVRDGNRNERVGVIVMGSKGPEFYSKNSKKSTTGLVPFRKSKSFLDGGGKSFEVMTVDCKNVFLSSSEPGPRPNYAINDIISPEDEVKIEEKMTKLNKNETDKITEEKFFKGVPTSELEEIKRASERVLKGAGEGADQKNEKVDKTQEESLKSRFPPIQFQPLEPFSPRTPKSLRKNQKKFNEVSKAIAETLNEQAKHFKENQKTKEETFTELREKFPPKEISPEEAEANLSLWGMKVNPMQEENEETRKEEEEEEEEEKNKKDELNLSDSIKSTDQMSLNKQRRKKYYEPSAPLKKLDESSCLEESSKDLTSPRKQTKSKTWTECYGKNFKSNPTYGELMGEGDSKNLESVYNKMTFRSEVCSNGAVSSGLSDGINTNREGKEMDEKCQSSSEEGKDAEKKEETEKGKMKNRKLKEKGNESESYLEEANRRKVSKMKNYFDEKIFDSKLCKKVQKERKSKKKIILEDKMRMLREALPSIAAENEAAHLKQLKKYIDRFIDRASSTSECRKRKEVRLKEKESASTDSSEVRVDARKILDFVSNPFKKISSDVTINIAKKLTDALVQDKDKTRGCHTIKQRRKESTEETDEEAVTYAVSSGSEQSDEAEPTYLKQLKRMRNEHLNNIVLEVKRLSELLRFLDRCNRLTF